MLGTASVVNQPQPPRAEFSAGDRISQPVYGRGWLEGELVFIDCVIEGQRIAGLVMLADPDEDGYRRYYEFLPHRARRLPVKGCQDADPLPEKTKPPRPVPQ